LKKKKLIDKKYEEIEKLRKLQNEHKNNKKLQTFLTQPIENLVDFDKIKKFENGIEQLKKEGRYNAENESYLLIDEHELNQIDGYHFQVKEHKEKMNKIFVPELIYLKFNAVLKNDNSDYFVYELDCKDIYKKYGIKEFNLYYAIAHYSHFDEYDYNEQNFKEKNRNIGKEKATI